MGPAAAWLVLNEQEQYINLIKNSSMPTIAVAVPVNQYIWQTIKSLNELARELTKTNSRLSCQWMYQ